MHLCPRASLDGNPNHLHAQSQSECPAEVPYLLLIMPGQADIGFHMHGPYLRDNGRLQLGNDDGELPVLDLGLYP